MSSSDKERSPQLLFVKALASRGRLEAIPQQMGYHPQYLDSFLRMQHYLLHMDGPLPFNCRHYIAVMVSAGNRLSVPGGRAPFGVRQSHSPVCGWRRIPWLLGAPVPSLPSAGALRF